jgi:two-component system heavy metal sensor histidine kinase CusS
MTGAATVVTAVTLGGAFAGVSTAFNRLQRRQLDEALRGVALSEAAEAPGNGFSFSDRPGPAANDVGPLTKYGVVYDERGAPLAATPPFDRDRPPASLRARPDHACFDFVFGPQRLRGCWRRCRATRESGCRWRRRATTSTATSASSFARRVAAGDLGAH